MIDIKFTVDQIRVTGDKNTAPQWAVLAKFDGEVRCYGVFTHGMHTACAALNTITYNTSRGFPMDFYSMPLVQTKKSKNSGKKIKYV